MQIRFQQVTTILYFFYLDDSIDSGSSHEANTAVSIKRLSDEMESNLKDTLTIQYLPK